jgi:predicted TIM-barrel fold metal-dependent hydrolase
MQAVLLIVALVRTPVAAAAERPNAHAMDSVLVKDWTPDSSLVVPVTNIPKARYPAIDLHVHIGMAGTGHTGGDTPESLAAWVKSMDEAGVEKAIVLSEAVGADFDRLADLYARTQPGRFQLWCGLDIRDFDQPGYPERAAAELERCYRKGARGVGELSDKGMGIMGGMMAAYGDLPNLPRQRRLYLDDPRLDLFWKKCAALKIPVNLHVADHPSAWRPPDNHQERLPRSQIYNQYGMDGPSYEELLARRDRLLARHPETTFIACHLSNQGNDLASLSKTMERFPNLCLEIAARDYEIGRQPRAAAKFLIKYKDRVMFGTDAAPGARMYRGWWRLLESADEYIPGSAAWRLYGLELPAPVLEALYRGNARRILHWDSGAGR